MTARILRMAPLCLSKVFMSLFVVHKQIARTHETTERVMIFVCILISCLSGAGHMAQAVESYNPNSETRNTFRFENLNCYLLVPLSELQSNEEISDILRGVLQRLFPAGTPIEEFDAFINGQANRPEIVKNNRVLLPHKRISRTNTNKNVIYIYRFYLSKSKIDRYIDAKTSTDRDSMRYEMIKTFMFAWIIHANLTSEQTIESISVKLEILAP